MSDGPARPASPSAAGARDVPVRDDGIRLGQLLKLADLVASGADAKALLAEGAVQVNGQVETRRGRQLARGDEIRVGDQIARLV
jgi:ribosome-associated protein